MNDTTRAALFPHIIHLAMYGRWRVCVYANCEVKGIFDERKRKVTPIWRRPRIMRFRRQKNLAKTWKWICMMPLPLPRKRMGNSREPKSPVFLFDMEQQRNAFHIGNVNFDGFGRHFFLLSNGRSLLRMLMPQRRFMFDGLRHPRTWINNKSQTQRYSSQSIQSVLIKNDSRIFNL